MKLNQKYTTKLFSIIIIMLLCSFTFLTHSDVKDSCCDEERGCKGSDYCRVCKSCEYCKWCNSGGSCGVCSSKNKNSNKSRQGGRIIDFIKIVKSNNLSVKETPHYNSNTIAVLKKGEQVFIIDENNGNWVKIRIILLTSMKKLEGYVQRENLLDAK